MKMKRYHITSKKQINEIAGFDAISSVCIGETFRTIIDAEDGDSIDLEEAMDADENVIAYRETIKA